MTDFQDIATFVLAGGGASGAVALLAKLNTFMKERRAGKLEREETSITRWQDIAETYKQDLLNERELWRKQFREQERELSFYRFHYPRVLSKYRVGPPPGTEDFPTTYVRGDPPVDDGNA